MKRRLLLSTLAAGASGFGWVRFGEPSWFQVTRTQVRGKRLPKLRVLHVSDLHVSDGMTPEELEVGWKAGLATKPDLICLTGDFVSSNKGFDKAGLMRMLRQAADTAPAFAVLGNHDGGSWLARRKGDASTRIVGDLVQQSGVRLLHNESTMWQGVRLVGSADMWSGQFHPQKAFSFAAHKTQPKEPTILLCHNPDGKAAFLPWHWDLMLSGHTHGGQGRIPGVNPFWVPVQDKRFVAGLYPFRDRQLFITRGIGSPKHVRAFCRPELSVLELAPA